MQPFHTINVSEMCGEVVLSQGVILLDQSATIRTSAKKRYVTVQDSAAFGFHKGSKITYGFFHN